MPKYPYDYRATVHRVIDGDTIVMDIDLGFGCWLHAQSMRLLGINAREKADAGGPEAKANLETLLPKGTTVLLSSVKSDKYGGRYDAIITLEDGTDLAHTLVEHGWAAVWTGLGPKPIPPWPRPDTA
jgi:endonuclease YncB( thermonuclease family)